MTKTLIWDASEGATGYKVYDNQVHIAGMTGTETAPLKFAPGKHAVYVTATGAFGESEPSEILSFVVPKKPGKPRFK